MKKELTKVAEYTLRNNSQANIMKNLSDLKMSVETVYTELQNSLTEKGVNFANFDKVAKEFDVYNSITALREDLKEIIGLQKYKPTITGKSLTLFGEEINVRTPHYLGEVFTSKKPVGYEYSNLYYEISNWREFLVGACEILYSKSDDNLKKLIDYEEFSSYKHSMFSNDIDYMEGYDSPCNTEIGNTGIYVYHNMSANNICSIIKKCFEIYDFDPSEIKIFLKE